MVYPFGVHDIYGAPAICQNLNRLICADVNNDRTLWDFNVGDIDVLAEPVVTDDRVLQGTTEGYLYSLNLKGPPNTLDRLEVQGGWRGQHGGDSG